MAAEAETPEAISVLKIEEAKELRCSQFDTVFDTASFGELQKVEDVHSSLPIETVDSTTRIENLVVAQEIKNFIVNPVVESKIGISEGECFLESPSLAKIALEETCQSSEECEDEETAFLTKKEKLGNETQLQKNQMNEAVEVIEDTVKGEKVVDFSKQVLPDTSLENARTEDEEFVKSSELSSEEENAKKYMVEKIPSLPMMSTSVDLDLQGKPSGEGEVIEEKKQINEDLSDDKQAPIEEYPQKGEILHHHLAENSEALSEEHILEAMCAKKNIEEDKAMSSSYKDKIEGQRSGEDPDLEIREEVVQRSDASPGHKQEALSPTQDLVEKSLKTDVGIAGENQNMEEIIEKNMELEASNKEESVDKNLDTEEILIKEEEETSSQEGLECKEEEKADLVGMEKGPETIRGNEEKENEKIHGDENSQDRLSISMARMSPKNPNVEAEILENEKSANYKLDTSSVMSVMEETSLQVDEPEESGTLQNTSSISLEEKSLETIVSSKKMNDKSTVEDEDGKNIDINERIKVRDEEVPEQSSQIDESEVKLGRLMEIVSEGPVNNLEKNFEGETKEGEPENNNDTSEHRIEKDKNPKPVELGEKTESTDVESPNKHADDLSISHPLFEESVQGESEKHQEISDVKPEEEIHEENGAPPEEEEHTAKLSKFGKSADTVILKQEKTTEGVTSGMMQTGEMEYVTLEKTGELDSKEKLHDTDATEKKEEDTRKEEASDTFLRINETECDDTIIENVDNNTVTLGDETIGECFKEDGNVQTDIEGLEHELKGENQIHQTNDAKREVLTEEINEGLEITDTGENTQKHAREEECTVKDLSMVSIGEETVKEKTQEDRKETNKPEIEVLEGLDTAHKHKYDEKQITEESSSNKEHSIVSKREEMVEESSQEDENDAKKHEEEVFKELEIACVDEDTGKIIGEEIETDHSTTSIGEEVKESTQEDEVYERLKAAGESDPAEKNIIEDIAITDLSTISAEEKKGTKSSQEDEECEELKTTGADDTETKIMEDEVITDISTLSVGEETKEERSREDEKEAKKHGEQVKESELISMELNLEATDSTESTQEATLEDEEDPHKSPKSFCVTESSEEETIQKANTQNEVILEKEECTNKKLETASVTTVTEKTSLHEVGPESEKLVDASDLAPAEMIPAIVEASKNSLTGLDGEGAKLEETSNLDEIANLDILTAEKPHADEAEELKYDIPMRVPVTVFESEDQEIEIITKSGTTANKIPSDEKSEEKLQESSMLASKEQELNSVETNEKTKEETPMEEETKDENLETPFVAETNEEMSMKKEEPGKLEEVTEIGSEDIGKENWTEEVQKGENLQNTEVVEATDEEVLKHSSQEGELEEKIIRPEDVVSEGHETAALNANAEKNTCEKEQGTVKNLEESFKEERKGGKTEQELMSVEENENTKDETPVEEETKDENLETPFVAETNEEMSMKKEEPGKLEEVTEIGSEDIGKENWTEEVQKGENLQNTEVVEATDEEVLKHSSQEGESEEKIIRTEDVVSEGHETAALNANAEKNTCEKEQGSVKNLEESFKEERKGGETEQELMSVEENENTKYETPVEEETKDENLETPFVAETNEEMSMKKEEPGKLEEVTEIGSEDIGKENWTEEVQKGEYLQNTEVVEATDEEVLKHSSQEGESEEKIIRLEDVVSEGHETAALNANAEKNTCEKEQGPVKNLEESFKEERKGGETEQELMSVEENENTKYETPVEEETKDESLETPFVAETNEEMSMKKEEPGKLEEVTEIGSEDIGKENWTEEVQKGEYLQNTEVVEATDEEILKHSSQEGELEEKIIRTEDVVSEGHETAALNANAEKNTCEKEQGPVKNLEESFKEERKGGETEQELKSVEENENTKDEIPVEEETKDENLETPFVADTNEEMSMRKEEPGKLEEVTEIGSKDIGKENWTEEVQKGENLQNTEVVEATDEEVLKHSSQEGESEEKIIRTEDVVSEVHETAASNVNAEKNTSEKEQGLVKNLEESFKEERKGGETEQELKSVEANEKTKDETPMEEEAKDENLKTPLVSETKEDMSMQTEETGKLEQASEIGFGDIEKENQTEEVHKGEYLQNTEVVEARDEEVLLQGSQEDESEEKIRSADMVSEGRETNASAEKNTCENEQGPVTNLEGNFEEERKGGKTEQDLKADEANEKTKYDTPMEEETKDEKLETPSVAEEKEEMYMQNEEPGKLEEASKMGSDDIGKENRTEQVNRGENVQNNEVDEGVLEHRSQEGESLEMIIRPTDSSSSSENAEKYTCEKEQGPIEEERKEIDTECIDDARENGTQKDEVAAFTDLASVEKNLKPVDLSVKIEGTVESPNKDDNDLSSSHPLVEEIVQGVCEKDEEYSNHKPEEDIHEENRAPPEEEEHIVETFEVRKSMETAILEQEKTRDGAATLEMSEMEYVKIKETGELDATEKSDVDAKENREKATENIEQISNINLHKNETQCEDIKEGILEEDIAIKDHNAVIPGTETTAQNSQEEQATELKIEDQMNKTIEADDSRMKGILNEEVCEEPKIVNLDEVTEKQRKEEDFTVEDLSKVFTGEEAVNDKSEGDKKEAEKPKEKECEGLETVSVDECIEKQIIQEEEAVKEHSMVSFREEKIKESSLEDEMVANKHEAEVSEGLQVVGASKNTEVHIIEENDIVNDHHTIPSAAKEIKPNFQGDEATAKKPKEDVCEEFETTGESEDNDKQIIEDDNSVETHCTVSIQEELVKESPQGKPNENDAKKPKEEVFEEPDTAGLGEESGKKICIGEAEVKTSSKEEEVHERLEATGKGEAAEKPTIEEVAVTELHAIYLGGEIVKGHSLEDEVCEEGKVDGKQIMKNQVGTDISMVSVREERTKESPQEDEKEAKKHEGEVKESDLICIERDIEAANSTEKTNTVISKDEEDSNKSPNAFSAIKASGEEIIQDENSEKPSETSSLVSEGSKEQIKEEISEKAEKNNDMHETAPVTMVTEKISLHEAEPEEGKLEYASYFSSEEKIPASIEASGTCLQGINFEDVKLEETTNLDGNADNEILAENPNADEAEQEKKYEIPMGASSVSVPESVDQESQTITETKITSSKFQLDDKPEENLQESSMLESKKQELESIEVNENFNDETPMEDEIKYENLETPLEDQILMTRKKEEPGMLEEATEMRRSEDIGKESPIPKLDPEEHLYGSKGEEIKSSSESVDQDQSHETLPQTEEEKETINENDTLSVEDQMIGQGSKQEEKKSKNLDEGLKSEAEDQSDKIKDEPLKNIVLNEKGVERAHESNDNGKQITEAEAVTKDFYTISVGDEIVKEVKDSDFVYTEQIFEASNSDENKEMEILTEEDLNMKPNASPGTEASRDEILRTECCEKHEEVSKSVSEVSEENIKEESLEEADNAGGMLDTESVLVVAEETSSQEAKPEGEKIVEASSIASKEKSSGTTETIKTDIKGDEVESLSLGNTSNLISQLPTIENEERDQESPTVGKLNADNVETSCTSADTGKDMREKEEPAKIPEETELLHDITKKEENAEEVYVSEQIETAEVESLKNNTGDLPITHSLIEESLVREVGAQSEEASNSQKLERSLESFPQSQIHETIITTKKDENKEGGDAIQDSDTVSVGDETVEISFQGDKEQDMHLKEESLKLVAQENQSVKTNEAISENEIVSEEVSVRLNNATASENTEKQISCEEEAMKDPYQISAGENHEEDEMKGEKFEEATKLGLEEQFHELETEETQRMKLKEATKNEISNDEVPDNTGSSEDIEKQFTLEEGAIKKAYLVSVGEETTKEIPPEDEFEGETAKDTLELEPEELSPELECGEHQDGKTKETTGKETVNKEVFKGIENAGASGNDEKPNTDEKEAVKDLHPVSVGVEKVKETSQEDEEEGKEFEEEADTLEPVLNNKSKCVENTTESAEIKSIDQVLERDLEAAGSTDKTETIISKDDEGPITDFNAPVTTNAPIEVGKKLEEVSALVFKEPIPETITKKAEKMESTTEDTSAPEGLIEVEKLKSTSSELESSPIAITEDFHIKDEVPIDNPEASYLMETPQAEVQEKESKITEDAEKQELEFVNQVTAEVNLPTEEREGENIKNEAPVEEILEKEGEKKLNEANIQEKICGNEDEETQMLKQEESFLNIEKIKKTPVATAEKQTSREKDSTESIETKFSAGSIDIQSMPEDPTGKTSQKAEVEDHKSGETSGIQSEVKGLEFEAEKQMQAAGEETINETKPSDSDKVSLCDIQRSTKETLEIVEELAKERNSDTNKEKLENKEMPCIQVEDEKTDEEEKDEEGEEEDEHKRADSGSDAPVMVEASRDIDMKPAHKKSHNILSGVGSKVKHSIAKVKKAITGKSSLHKPPTPTPNPK